MCFFPILSHAEIASKQVQKNSQNQEKSQEKVIRIYQDADLSNHIESSESIQKGIEVAFDEIGNTIEGYKVEFKYLDHRGNVVRSKKNYQEFIADPKALAIYSGVHSPPLIKNRTFINESKALTLVPWAAGGPVTRHPSKENWIFRLSVDDMRAGPVIVDYAMNIKKCNKPHLLLESTPWGDSNLKSMSLALEKYGISAPAVTRFGWNLKDQGARIILRKIISDAGNDCILLVANAVEGVVIAQAFIDVSQGQKNVPVISHWGITGGNFHEIITAEKREKMDLSFIQSCFAFTNQEQTEFSQDVFKKLVKVSKGSIKEVKDLKSAVGFIHAYDLTKLLIAAIKKTGLTGDNEVDKEAIRLALENLDMPIKGLVKTYENPYSVFDPKTNTNAHEALHKENFCMARYGSEDEILIDINAASAAITDSDVEGEVEDKDKTKAKVKAVSKAGVEKGTPHEQ